MSANDLKTSPLQGRHEVLGAKMADFGGWLMPIEYAGGGVLAEHKAVRDGVGIFDVSHLGKVSVTGAGASDFVNSVMSSDIGRIEPGSAQYTLCCDESSGGVVDDLILYLNGPDDVFLVPNAANSAEVVRRMNAVVPGGVTINDQQEQYGVIAVQGPNSAELLHELGLPTDMDYMAFVPATYSGAELTVCRTGYTGELGYELVVDWDSSELLWDALLERGYGLGARACGLGARDTLRTEMGYPLHGQDLSLQITPNQARSGWAVGWQKPAFWGREPLSAERAAKPARLLWGLESTDRGIPRPHMQVIGVAGTPVGEVTSGTFSPTLRKGIGLALIDRESGLGEGDEVQVDVRGRTSVMRIVKPPFVPSHVR
ncbi:MAG: glycine cleavage system aminomethyltransferase GcvT [Cumulibacter sp.]